MNPNFISDTTPLTYNDYGEEPTTAYDVDNVTIGPIYVNDPSELLNYRYWATYYDPDTMNIVLQDFGDGTTTVILNEEDGVEEIGLAFDQNANDVYAWITGLGELKLRWYDANVLSDVIIDIGQAQSVVITQDTKYFPGSTESDILIFYVRDKAIYYRVQRDKYAIEYSTPIVTGATRLLNSGSTTGYRFQVRYI